MEGSFIKEHSPHLTRAVPVLITETNQLILFYDMRALYSNRILRRITELKRCEVTGGWRKLHNEELHNLYSSPSIIRMIKSRRMRRKSCSTNGKGKKCI
jgi:hypothetical protein